MAVWLVDRSASPFRLEARTCWTAAVGFESDGDTAWGGRRVDIDRTAAVELRPVNPEPVGMHSQAAAALSITQPRSKA